MNHESKGEIPNLQLVIMYVLNKMGKRVGGIICPTDKEPNPSENLSGWRGLSINDHFPDIHPPTFPLLLSLQQPAAIKEPARVKHSEGMHDLIHREV